MNTFLSGSLGISWQAWCSNPTHHIERRKKKKKETGRRIHCFLSRALTETWATITGRRCRAAALSGHCWRDLCNAQINENVQQLKASSLSRATCCTQTRCNLIKREQEQGRQASRLMMPCRYSSWLHRTFFFPHTLAPTSRLQAKHS